MLIISAIVRLCTPFKSRKIAFDAEIASVNSFLFTNIQNPLLQGRTNLNNVMMFNLWQRF